MNTIQYFLSTLRPAPPPSARASTSGLRIDNELPDLAEQASSPLRSVTAPHVYPSIDAQMQGVSSAATIADSGPVGTVSDQIDAAAATPSDDDDHDDKGSSHSDSSLGESPPSGAPLARISIRRGGKAPARSDSAQPTLGVALEDPLRDGASIRTEVERGEGVELGADTSPRGTADAQAVPTPPPPTYGAATTPVADLASPIAASREKRARVASSSWPWVSKLARWWPVRVTASLFILLRRFLALFPVPFLARPGYNAVFAPPRLPQKRLQPPSPSVLRPSARPASDEEKGLRNARVVSLELSVASPNALPPALQRQRARSISPPSAPVTTSIPRAPAAPPRLTPKTLVLDLDETLIHSTSRAIGLGGAGGKRGTPKGLKTRVVEVVLDGRSTVYTVYKRPWVDFFLRKVRPLAHSSSQVQVLTSHAKSAAGVVVVHGRHLHCLPPRIRGSRH